MDDHSREGLTCAIMALAKWKAMRLKLVICSLWKLITTGSSLSSFTNTMKWKYSPSYI